MKGLDDKRAADTATIGSLSRNAKDAKRDRILNKSILLIDDDPGMLRALKRVLRNEGAIVTCAEWAGDAVEILTRRQGPIDLVITDQRMPFVTGAMMVYAIRQIFPALPVIVLTAYGNPELQKLCLNEGAAAFLEKPINAEHLLTAILECFFL